MSHHQNKLKNSVLSHIKIWVLCFIVSIIQANAVAGLGIKDLRPDSMLTELC